MTAESARKARVGIPYRTKKEELTEQLTDSLSNILLGEKIPLDVVNGETGEVIIPGLIKLNVVVKPATPERQGINPFTKEPTTFKAKPARKVVKAHALKALKDAVK